MDAHQKDYLPALQQALKFSDHFLSTLDQAPVSANKSYEELKANWNWKLPENGEPAETVIEDLNNAAVPGLIRNQSGRVF